MIDLLTKEELLCALRTAGVQPKNLRDGVHEAVHAMAWGVEPPWTRERISAAAPERVGDKFAAEVLARAVEEMVCAALGETIPSREERAMLAAMEAIKLDGYRVPGGLRAWVEAIGLHVDFGGEACGLRDRILGLGGR